MRSHVWIGCALASCITSSLAAPILGAPTTVDIDESQPAIVNDSESVPDQPSLNQLVKLVKNRPNISNSHEIHYVTKPSAIAAASAQAQAQAQARAQLLSTVLAQFQQLAQMQAQAQAQNQNQYSKQNPADPQSQLQARGETGDFVKTLPWNKIAEGLGNVIGDGLVKIANYQATPKQNAQMMWYAGAG